MIIEARGKYYTRLNREIKQTRGRSVTVRGVLGQRYLGTGAEGKALTVFGTLGNALGAYLNGTDITVYGNVQDAVGDTMDSGDIVVHGSAGDTLGYGMRGGSIYVQGDAGYRVGIHMKAYREKHPTIVIGGKVGAFLGEYQAGGTIVVLGIGCGGAVPMGPYCGTGMHGGEMFIRCDAAPQSLPAQVEAERCGEEDLARLAPLIKRYCDTFEADPGRFAGKPFYKLTPSAGNPYNNLYTTY